MFVIYDIDLPFAMYLLSMDQLYVFNEQSFLHLLNIS